MIDFRQATVEDCIPIARLHADSWKRTYRGILSDDYLDQVVDQERLTVWTHRFNNPPGNQHIVVATIQEKIIGFCCAYIDDDPAFGTLVDNLHVIYENQKTGIARRLMHMIATHVNDNATSNTIYLWVYESNTNARLAYEKLGGINFETIEKENSDGTISRVCRIIWSDASKIC